MEFRPTKLSFLAEGYTPIDVWMGLRSTSRMWAGTYAYLGEIGELPRLDETIAYARSKARMLSAVPVANWVSIFNGEGWTPLACSLASWCEGATLELVVTMWSQMKARAFALPNEDFAACLMNPDMLPSLNLSSLVRAGKDLSGISLLIAARQEAPIFDYEDDQWEKLDAHLKSMFEARGAGR